MRYLIIFLMLVTLSGCNDALIGAALQGVSQGLDSSSQSNYSGGGCQYQTRTIMVGDSLQFCTQYTNCDITCI